MKKLPIGIQTFENLIEENYYYVDKTPFIKKLTDDGKYYFLSRPRRFGKSLFLSTIKSAFQGQKELFKGLYIYDNWNWDEKYPVVHISFGSGVHRSVDELKNSFGYFLTEYKKQYKIKYAYSDLKNQFAELIKTLYEKFNKGVVVLIDEYDKPILDNIENKETAIAIREELKNYYSVIKDSDPYIKFVFITGVSKFSRVSLFSGLNNLEDITINGEYSDICGYTQEELKIFKERLECINLDEVRKWYNGYNWFGKEVYNPFSILLFLKNKEYRSYWFETGSPSFLIKLFQSGKYYIPDLSDLTAGEEIVGSFDIDTIKVETLLFQAGYLTIKKIEQIGAFRRYQLTYPNLEVKSSLTNSILTSLVDDVSAKVNNQSNVLDALANKDFHKLKNIFYSFFASIPHDWYRKNQLSGYEGYYASIVYCYFTALGLEVIPEDTTNHGKIDLTIHFENKVYIIEFKVNELTNSGSALQQIKDKGYADKFQNQEVYLIGVEFSKEKRNIIRFEWEKKEKIV